MRYMMFIKHTEDYRKDAVPASLYEEMGKFIEETPTSGNFVSAAGLQPSSAGARVRLKSGKITVTDGPFAETREQLGGFYLVDAENLDEAIAIADRIPMARRGTVEVRPVAEITGLPEV